MNEIDYISVNSNPYYNLKEKLFYALKNSFTVNFIPRLALLKKKHSVYNVLKENFKEKYKNRINYVPHHRSHISLAYFSSGFQNAIGFSYDAAGDFSTAEAYLCTKDDIRLIKKTIFPHSLGIFYQAMTQFVGFKKYGEIKFMGLAAYGEPIFVNKIRKLVKYDLKNLFELDLKYFRHQKIGFSFTLRHHRQIIKSFSEKMENLLGPSLDNPDKIGKREMDIALFYSNSI